MTIPRRPGLMVASLAFLLVAIGAATNVLPLRQIVEQRQEVTDARAKLDSLINENVLMEEQVDGLSSPVEIERLAREQLGYVRPGEQAYVIVEPEQESPAVISPDDPQVHTSEDPAVGIFERIWAFLSGSDLVEE